MRRAFLFLEEDFLRKLGINLLGRFLWFWLHDFYNCCVWLSVFVATAKKPANP